MGQGWESTGSFPSREQHFGFGVGDEKREKPIGGALLRDSLGPLPLQAEGGTL